MKVNEINVRLAGQSIELIKGLIKSKIYEEITKVEHIADLLYKFYYNKNDSETYFLVSVYYDKSVEIDVLCVRSSFNVKIFEQFVFEGIEVVTDKTLALESKDGSMSNYCNEPTGVSELTQILNLNMNRIKEVKHKKNPGRTPEIIYIPKTEKDFNFFNQFFNNYSFI